MVLIALGLISVTRAQRYGYCMKPTFELLNGSQGLLSTALGTSISGEELHRPDVKLFDFNIVCLATTERFGYFQ